MCVITIIFFAIFKTTLSYTVPFVPSSSALSVADFKATLRDFSGDARYALPSDPAAFARPGVRTTRGVTCDADDENGTARGT